MQKTYSGSCHCGAVRFECDLDLAQGTNRCNCSFCRKNRFWMAIVKADAFRLLAGSEALVDYQHAPPGRPEPFLHLFFCGRCGVRAFSKGGFMPALGAEFYAVSLGCLDDVSIDELVSAPVRYFNGQADDWATPLAGETRHL
jgi:hypothetical protein